jgi:hypothetical protein
MMRVLRPAAAILVAALFHSPADLRARIQSSQVPERTTSSARCVALPLPSVRGADGNATDLSTALRDLVSSYLTGPSLRTLALDARLPEQALEEARQKNCPAVLTITLTRKKSGGGVFGQALGDAAGAAAWHMPYGGSAATTAVRSAAMAGSAAVSSIASNTRAKDQMEIEYRLSDGQRALRNANDRAKARTDGEDLVTPLVERMAAAIVAAVAQ